jgi:hypothetical protein
MLITHFRHSPECLRRRRDEITIQAEAGEVTYDVPDEAC